MIYKMFNGVHIDLSKVVAVGPIVPLEDNRMGFRVSVQLMDRPLTWFIPPLTEKDGELIREQAVAASAKAIEEGLSDEARKEAFKLARGNAFELVRGKKQRILEDAHADLMAAWRAVSEVPA